MRKILITILSLIALVLIGAIFSSNKPITLNTNLNQTPIEKFNQTANGTISNTNNQTAAQNNTNTTTNRNNRTPQTTCSYNEYFGCKTVTQGREYNTNNPSPTVCGCFPNSCPSDKYLTINGGEGQWSDGSYKGTYSCSDTQVS